MIIIWPIERLLTWTAKQSVLSMMRTNMMYSNGVEFTTYQNLNWYGFLGMYLLNGRALRAYSTHWRYIELKYKTLSKTVVCFCLALTYNMYLPFPKTSAMPVLGGIVSGQNARRSYQVLESYSTD